MTHKEFQQVVNDDFYQVLMVGASKNDAGYELKDDIGDNISSKNSSYCELTGLYWIWKNRDENITGVCHYRRYFTESIILGRRRILTQEKMQEYLSNSDIIMPHKRLFDGKCAKDFYAKHHNVSDWENMEQTIHRLYPEYDDDVAWFAKQKRGYCYNMFITNKVNFDKYCDWLFAILFELEKMTDEAKYSAYNRRVYGFLSERMLNIWIHHNKLKVRETYVYNPKLFSMLANQTKGYIKRKIKGEKK